MLPPIISCYFEVSYSLTQCALSQFESFLGQNPIDDLQEGPMKGDWFSSYSTSRRFISGSIVILLFLIGITTGCGSSGSSPDGLKLSGNTSVTVMLSSTANAELQQFRIGFQSIALTNQSGKTVTLFSTPEGAESWVEFIHVNGGIEPFVTVSIPQDIYTSAAVTVDQSDFTCVSLTPSGGLITSTFAYGATPNNAPETNVTVNLSSPITVTGKSMGLVLDLQVAQSATYSNCYVQGIEPFSITPTFDLRPISIASQPTNAQNGKVSQLDGQITATTGSDFTLSLPNTQRTVTVSTSGNALYQGISGFSALTIGTFVDLDGAIQNDGSVLATRIAVLDSSATNVQSGPAIIVGGDPLNGELAAWFYTRAYQGQDPIPAPWAYNIHSAMFQISQQMGNVSTLPFVASFNGSNLVAGQNVYVSSNTFKSPNDPYTPASRLTLMPQTIHGTVLASQPSGSFMDYTVSLATYDLFPTLAVQGGQTTLLNNPGQIEVYIDRNTQKLNTQPLAPGSTLRFYGLVFNDNGTLRMDCAQVNDGVISASRPTMQVQGHTQLLRRLDRGIVQQFITITK